MRILVLTNLYPNPFQPQRAPFIRQQLRFLSERAAVMVIAPILWPAEVAGSWKAQTHLPPDRRLTHDGLTVVHPRFLYPPRLLRSWHGTSYQWSVRRAFKDAVAEFQPDLLFTPWAYPDGWAAVRLGHQAGLAVVIKVLGSDVRLLQPGSRRWQQSADALREADGVVAVSRDLAQQVIAMGAAPTNVRVVYDGVDMERFNPGSQRAARMRLGLPAEQPIVLFVGNLVPVKGIDVLIDACVLLARSGVSFTTYVLGEGPLRAALQRRVTACGLQDRVTLMGSRPHDQLPDWFRSANVLALPSHSEGVPSVLLEAAACGTPFVASRVGGIPEIAHLGTSDLVTAGDCVALAAALRRRLIGGVVSTRTDVPMRDWHESAAELADLFDEKIKARNPNGHHNRSVPDRSISR